ncbi:MAG: dihydrolipoamide dehydrogenase [Candidatus Azotimanducaceae bacterium]|jgi:dihydrolipoamide dehydrogenase
MKQYELIIIGGGRAANLAIEAGKQGRRVALIEKEVLGGTCPNRGCVPSKLLIGYAEVARQIKEADRFFIDAEIKNIDVEKMFAATNQWISQVDPRYEDRLPDSVDLYRGHARFLNNEEISVNGETLCAEKIVIATGSRSSPTGQKSEYPVWTSENLFPLSRPPKSITIVGGGYIACELGSFFHAVGIDTQLIVRGDRLLKLEDTEISDIFTREFSGQVPTLFNTSMENVTWTGDQFNIQLSDREGLSSQRSSDALLFATGRVPNTDELGIEHTDLLLDNKGFLEVDDNLQTSVQGIYAAGDVAGNYMFQHAASFEVSYLAKKLLENETGAINYGMMPHAVFSEPEVAGVGETEQSLESKKIDYIKVVEPWSGSARALAMKVEYPRTKLLVSRQGALLGCHLIGPQATTLLHEVLPVMQIKNDVRVLAETIHVHPGLSEVILEAARRATELLGDG